MGPVARSLLTVGTAAAVAASGVTLAVVGAVDVGGKISGCVLKSSGVVRVIDPSTTQCKSTETPLTWNVSGPAGPAGPAGAAGATGPAGPAGPSEIWTAGAKGTLLVGDGATLAQLDVPAGTYLATVSSRLYSQGADTSGTAVCTLSPNSPMTSVPRGDDQVFAPTWIDAGVSGWHTSSVQQVITLDWPGKVYLACTSAVRTSTSTWVP